MKRYIFIFWFLCGLPLFSVGQSAIDTSSLVSPVFISYDSILIDKNWRTKDKIVQRILDFPEKGEVCKARIDTAMSRLWNTGNFVQVEYRIDTLPNQKKILNVIAKDKFTIVPILAIAGNKENYRIGVGVEDKNLLGKNIEFYAHAGFTSNGNNLEFGLKIPRQLLPKNSEMTFWLEFGKEYYCRRDNGATSDWVGFQNREVKVWLGNPNQQDYKYCFSPDLGINYYHHRTDRSILKEKEDIDIVDDYEGDFFELTLAESIGTVNQKRHRKSGYNAYVEFRQAFDVRGIDHHFRTLEFGAEAHFCLNSWLQLSTWTHAAYTSSNLASFQYHLGPNLFKGINVGEISGKTFYYAYAGAHITWINREWLALEQGFFVNWGRGDMMVEDLWQRPPVSAIGTSFTFNVPMVSFLAGSISFSYTIGNINEFSVYF